MSPLLCWKYIGLAFSNYFIETLPESGFKIGLSRAMASKLAAMTVHSAAQVMLKFGRHPNELMDKMRLSSEATDCRQILDKTGVASVVSASFESLRERFDKFGKI
jgi:pyrroline-5-carboxylate reductase